MMDTRATGRAGQTPGGETAGRGAEAARRRVLQQLAAAWPASRLAGFAGGGVGLGATGTARAAFGGDDDDLLGYAPRAPLPPGYPAPYLQTIRAAEDEGRLVVYSTTDATVAQPLIDDFRSLFPRIDVDYEDQTATELNHRFIAETQLGRAGADVLWSSAMDQQAVLIDRGMALPHALLAEGLDLPDWARLGNLGWSTTLEPIAIVHDRRRLSNADVASTHADLLRLLEADPARFDRRIVLYDVEKSGVGFLLATQDARHFPAYWALMAAIGRCRPRFALTAEAMLRAIDNGSALIAYNVLGDYARARAAGSSALGVTLPEDYTLVLSRVMFISRQAAHPNAARLWVDYLMSRRGQRVLADRSRLHAVRDDIDGERSAAALRAELGSRLQPITFDARLGQALAPAAYADFIGRWRQAMGRSRGR